ncbi:MAG: hypothetical protein K2K45_12330 [Muribaculaceae bacterium]|nr:hypothetical protein [Muribaculaceae bacterium]
MIRFVYAFFMGLMLVGISCFMTLFFGTPSPQAGLMFIAIMFTIGIIAGWHDYGRKQRKKEEEEERQAEQDRTNELMREYLEKKLREEKDK